MSTEILKEWVDINMAENGKMVIPRRVLELAASEIKFRIYQYLFTKARHTAGWESYKQGSRKGQLYLNEGELIVSEREISKVLGIHPSQTHRGTTFLVGHYFMKQQKKQGVSITIICNYKELIKFKNDERSSERNSPEKALNQQPNGTYLISMPYEALTNGVTNGVTREEESDSPRIESPPLPSSKEKSEAETSSPSFPYQEKFSEFWQAYPKRKGIKVGKEAALTRFRGIVKNEETFQRLMQATGNYSGEKYPKDASRFLKEKFWEDWIDQAPQIQTELKSKSSMEVSNMKPSECPFPNYRAQDPMGGSTRKFEPEKIQRPDDPGAAKRAQAIVQELTERKTKPSVYWPKFKSEPEPARHNNNEMTEGQKEQRKAELRRQAEVLKTG